MKLDKMKFIAALTAKGITMAKLSEISGVSKATLSAAKNGKTCAYITAVKIARALEIDVMELIETEV